VLAGWIAETLVDSRAHRIPHFVRQMSGGIVVKIDFVNHMDLGGLGGKISFYGVARFSTRQPTKSIPKTLFGTENWQDSTIQGVFDTYGHHQKIF
jgi:hypothetical protein